MNNADTGFKPRLRALVVGTLGSLIIGGVVPYTNMVLLGPHIAAYFNTPAAIILLFFFIAVGNVLLGLVRRGWMLRSSELALVYIMWTVTTSIPLFGLTAFLIPHIVAPIYYATPENNWFELLLPIIPDWMIVHHEFTQIKNFFEGAPQGEGVPWALWLRPLVYWIPFVLALYMAMISIMVILRKQWIENERLVFPLVQVAIFMVRDETGNNSRIKPFLKNPLMWLGFAVPAIVQSLNGLNYYFPFIPSSDIAELGRLHHSALPRLHRHQNSTQLPDGRLLVLYQPRYRFWPLVLLSGQYCTAGHLQYSRHRPSRPRARCL